jgi:hypothetical protein
VARRRREALHVLAGAFQRHRRVGSRARALRRRLAQAPQAHQSHARTLGSGQSATAMRWR